MKDAAIVHAITYCSLFLGSGIANTLTVQLIYDNIHFDARTMFTNICIFMGYAMLKFIPPPFTFGTKKWKPATIVPRNKYVMLAIFDCIASLCTTVGQIAIGSGLFQVVFSSKIIFGALLSRFVLKKPLSSRKWLAIIVIVIGLCICVIKPQQQSSLIKEDNTINQIQNDYSHLKFTFGIICVLFASFIFSASHIYTEYVISEYEVSPFQFASRYGYHSVVCCLLYILSVTYFNRVEWVIEPVLRAPQGSTTTVLMLFVLLSICSVLRSSGVFTLLASYGTVTVGVLYAIQSIVVFFSSALFLCDPLDPIRHVQCITTPKLMGSLIVILGGLAYTFTAYREPSPKQEQPLNKSNIKNSEQSTTVKK